MSNQKKETRDFYDSISGVYDSLAEGSEGPIKELAVETLNARGGECILEIGCGTGHVLAHLAQSAGPTGQVFGLDLSTGMLASARYTVAQADVVPSVHLICADAAQLPLRDACVDAIFMSFTLELFDSEEAPWVLRECRRVLKTSGRIAVAAVSTEGSHGVAFEVYVWMHRHFPRLVDCRPIALAQLLESTGFQPKNRMLTNMWVPVEIVLAAVGCGRSA